MIKTCHTCHHTGELTWRDGKYYCAMCGTEISETEPQVQPQRTAVVNNATCPICKNRDNNIFDGTKYRCSLCGTPFDLQQPVQTPNYNQYNTNYGYSNRAKELKKEKDKNVGLGILFVFLFWPVAVYFFYKAYKLHNEIKELGY